MSYSSKEDPKIKGPRERGPLLLPLLMPLLVSILTYLDKIKMKKIIIIIITFLQTVKILKLSTAF